MNKIFFKAGLLLLPLLIGSCSDNEQIIAKVGETEIKSSVYMERLKKIREQLDLPDNGEVRRNLLKTYVDEKLLVEEAGKLGYDSDSAAVEKLNTIKLQELLNLYLQKEIYDKIDLSDDALKAYFFKMNTKLHVRHLYADTKKEADSLYNLILQGYTFADIAKDVFNDPVLRENGGDLGYMGFDEMQLDFAEEAFRLKPGEISKPVKINYGYSIIKVEDRRGNPLLTEAEFLKQKSQILKAYSKYAAKKASKDHADDIQKNLSVQINNEVFDQLYRYFKQGIQNKNISEQNSQNSIVSDDTILLTSETGVWSVATFREKAQYTSAAQRNWIKNKENFRDFIKGLVAREYIKQKAQDAGYDESAEYKDNVEEKFVKYQIDRLKEDILASIDAPEDSLQKYYSDNKNVFTVPARINLREIVLSDAELADKIKNKLNQGKVFADLARKYSENKVSAAAGGETGFIELYQFGPMAAEIKQLKPGTWKGPFKIADLYYFVQCIEQQESQVLPFASVKTEVEQKYRAHHFDQAMDNRLQQIRANTFVVTYPQKLKSLKYN